MMRRCRLCHGFLFTSAAACVIVWFGLFSWSSRATLYTSYSGVDHGSALTSTGGKKPKTSVDVFTDEEFRRTQGGVKVGETLKGVKRTLPNHDEGWLREYQSSVDEAWRLRELLLNSNDARPPTLTTENCTRLILEETKRYTNTNKRHTSNTNTTTSRPPRSMSEVLALTDNCTRYVLYTGFRFARVSEEELSFPLAFSIMAYKDLEQVERLLRAVYRPHNVYCVHADRKSDEDFQSGLRLIVGCLPNVFMVDRSVDVQWGKFSVLEPEMECMRRLIAHRSKWRYFINLTGQEFPLKTNRELVQILTALHGANDIDGTHNEMYHFRWRNSKPAPYNLTISKGDLHVLASRGYVDYVVKSRVARDLYEWLRDSFIPDETFFSTMNHNPKLGVPGSYLGAIDKISKNPLRGFTIWSFQHNAQCAGKWVRMVCHFGVGDLPRLTATPSLIANKFSYDYQPLAYDCLEKWYFDKVRQENVGLAKPLNVSLYEDSDMVKYRYTGPVLIWA